jgi:hypothetical protein
MKSLQTPDIQFIENAHIRVGITRKWGGAITHVSVPGGPNIINSHDLGRQIQQSYYSGPPNYQKAGKEKSKAWSAFPWNPIQTGDAYRNGSQVVDVRIGTNTLYVKTIPMLWPMNNDPGECTMETWITLSATSPAFTYRARLTNHRSDKTQYKGGAQEVPAVYVNGPYHRLLMYTGDKPFTGDALRELRNDHKEDWPWVNSLPTEGWAALVNDAGTGIGVMVPSPLEFHGGYFGKRGVGGETDANTGYMSPIASEVLDHNVVFDYRADFVVGSIGEIRAAAEKHRPRGLPAWDFSERRSGWIYQSGTDAGFPLKGRGLGGTPEPGLETLRLLGPYAFWQASTAKRVRLQISAKTAGRVRAFWRGLPPADASTKPSLWSAWRGTWFNNARSVSAMFPAGKKLWVDIDLSGNANYKGAICGLGLDIPADVYIHKIQVKK